MGFGDFCKGVLVTHCLPITNGISNG